MSKKNLLNESTIRKFMKLASIEPLASDFLGRIQEAEEELEEDLEEGRDKEELDEAEEDLEEGRDDDLEEGRDKEDMDEGKHDDDLDERGDMMFKDDEEMDMGLDMDAEEPAAGGMVSVDQLMSALEKALGDVLGQEVEVSQDDDEMDVGMDLDVDAPDAGDELGLDADAEEEEEEEELEEATPKTDVVEEVYARVIQRLTQETKSNKK